ncbi:MAG TPA: hypothetical protein DIS78_09580 [Lachnospiraceae bacterium]|nr:hypothetical protein [Lachnospiraceae bacterium]
MNNKDRKTTQITLMIRVIVAVYLIYLAHGLITGLDTAPNRRLMAIVAVVFTFAGVLIIAFTIKAFVNREYTDVRDVNQPDNDGKEEQTEGTVVDESVSDEGIEDNKDINYKGLETDSKDEQW